MFCLFLTMNSPLSSTVKWGDYKNTRGQCEQKSEKCFKELKDVLEKNILRNKKSHKCSYHMYLMLSLQ